MKPLERIDREQNKALTKELMKCQELINDLTNQLNIANSKVESSKSIIKQMQTNAI